MADVYPFSLWKNILDIVVIPGLNVASVHIKTDTYPGLFAFKLPRGQPRMFFQLWKTLTWLQVLQSMAAPNTMDGIKLQNGENEVRALYLRKAEFSAGQI